MLSILASDCAKPLSFSLRKMSLYWGNPILSMLLVDIYPDPQHSTIPLLQSLGFGQWKWL